MKSFHSLSCRSYRAVGALGGGQSDGPVGDVAQAEQSRAVGVDSDVGRDDADQVHDEAGLHHVGRRHRRGAEHDGVGGGGHGQHERVRTRDDRRQN